jgi:hypothetical protein
VFTVTTNDDHKDDTDVLKLTKKAKTKTKNSEESAKVDETESATKMEEDSADELKL